jgi:hypothetical protein
MTQDMTNEIQNIPHSIPVGALVSIYNPKVVQHRCSLYVVDQHWDVDGTPLYDLSFDPNAKSRKEELTEEYSMEQARGNKDIASLISTQWNWVVGSIATGFPERCLTVVPLLGEV